VLQECRSENFREYCSGGGKELYRKGAVWGGRVPKGREFAGKGGENVRKLSGEQHDKEGFRGERFEQKEIRATVRGWGHSDTLWTILGEKLESEGGRDCEVASRNAQRGRDVALYGLLGRGHTGGRGGAFFWRIVIRWARKTGLVLRTRGERGGPFGSIRKVCSWKKDERNVFLPWAGGG